VCDSSGKVLSKYGPAQQVSNRISGALLYIREIKRGPYRLSDNVQPREFLEFYRFLVIHLIKARAIFVRIANTSFLQKEKRFLRFVAVRLAVNNFTITMTNYFNVYA